MEFFKDAMAFNDKNALEELDISLNGIEITGINYLSTYIDSANCHLKKLNVTECGIQGPYSLNFFKAVKRSSTLRHLKADKNDFSCS